MGVLAFSPLIHLLSPTKLAFEFGWFLMTLANFVVCLLLIAVFLVGIFVRLPGTRRTIAGGSCES